MIRCSLLCVPCNVSRRRKLMARKEMSYKRVSLILQHSFFFFFMPSISKDNAKLHPEKVRSSGSGYSLEWQGSGMSAEIGLDHLYENEKLQSVNSTYQIQEPFNSVEAVLGGYACWARGGEGLVKSVCSCWWPWIGSMPSALVNKKQPSKT